jgi:hypothetical protein
MSKIKDAFRLACKSSALEHFGGIKESKSSKVAQELVHGQRLSSPTARHFISISLAELGTTETGMVAVREAAKKEGWKSSKSTFSYLGDALIGNLNRKPRHEREHVLASNYLLNKFDTSENTAEFITTNKAISAAVLMNGNLGIGLRDYHGSHTIQNDKEELKEQLLNNTNKYQDKIVKRAKIRGITKGTIIIGGGSTITGAAAGSVIPIFGNAGGALLGASLGIPLGWSLGKKINVTRVKYGLQENFKSDFNHDTIQGTLNYLDAQYPHHEQYLPQHNIEEDNTQQYDPQSESYIDVSQHHQPIINTDDRELTTQERGIISPEVETQANNTANHIPFDGSEIIRSPSQINKDLAVKRMDTGPLDVPLELRLNDEDIEDKPQVSEQFPLREGNSSTLQAQDIDSHRTKNNVSPLSTKSQNGANISQTDGIAK